ncbi:MAG TPA: Vi polysaccharide biosynthesis protein VipA/TviB [Rhodobacteraceae bacterium]|nr:Vi polysaccharide biosynthesis protein VipA/TviB [Paracoccaceae bacterium]
MKKIAVVGLGYVGLPLAVEFGKTRQVVGFDINIGRVEQLQSGHDVTNECSTDELNAAKLLNYSSSLDDIRDARIYIVTVPTPIDSVNRPNLHPLETASKTVGSVLKAGDIVIYESTVFPGATEEICVPILEQESGLQFNNDFVCGYSPERINPGDKVNTLTKIKKITSGSTVEVTQEVDSLYKSIITAGTFIASSIKVAEAAKVIENTQRDLNIALVNELSVIFGRLGIDTLDVLEAAGSKWNFLPFRPGLVGGHCIGVDPYYLTHKAEQVGYNPQVILAGRRINDNMAQYMVKKFVQGMIQNNIDVSKSTVGLLGITFKENCPDIRNSKAIDIVTELQSWNINVVVVDPWADPSEVDEIYGLKLGKVSGEQRVDSLIVAVGHDQFRELSPVNLRQLCNGTSPVLADVKSLYNRQDAADQGFTVFRL